MNHAQGRHEVALEFFLKSLAVYEAEYGEEHLETAATCGKLGTALNAIGEHDEALGYLIRTLRIQGTILGPDHPDVSAIRDVLQSLDADDGM